MAASLLTDGRMFSSSRSFFISLTSELFRHHPPSQTTNHSENAFEALFNDKTLLLLPAIYFWLLSVPLLCIQIMRARNQAARSRQSTTLRRTPLLIVKQVM